MTDRELRRLSRMELIQLLLEQAREMERLRQELDNANRRLKDRQILIQNAGSIAEAAFQLTHIMETAQETADRYVENVKRVYEEETARQYIELAAKWAEMEKNTENLCRQMLEDAKRKADGDGSSE